MPEIIVYEAPQGQQRARTAGGHHYTPSATLEAQRRIRQVWLESGFGLISGAVSVDITAALPRPKHHYGAGRNAGSVRPSAPRYPTGKPDRDNLDKLVLDALTGAAFADDAAVVDGRIAKRYARSGDRPCWVISVEPMPEEDD
jgi:crossover junction endodeoxyribonuclease RusA